MNYNVYISCISDPSALFRCPLQKLQPWEISHNSASLAANHLKQLLKYANYAESLSVLASQCGWICSHPELLVKLQGVTKSVGLFVVNDVYYAGVRTLLWKLINEGCLTQVKLSNITSALSKENLLDLLKICAGVKVEAQLPKSAVPCTSKRGVKRCREEETSNQNKFTTSITLTPEQPAKKIKIRLDDPDESQCVSVETEEDSPAIVHVIDFTQMLGEESQTLPSHQNRPCNNERSPDEKEGTSAYSELDGGNMYLKNFNSTTCNKNAEESASCSGVTTSTVHQDSDSRHSCDSFDNSSNSSEFHLQSFGASSYSRLPTQVENEEVAPFINSDQSEDEGNTMTFEDEDEDFSNIDLYNEAVQPMSSPFQGPSVSRVSNILVHPRPVWQRFGASLNVDLPLLRVDGPLRDIESFALSCQAGNTDLDIGQSLVQVLPHWKSLSKLALVDAGIGRYCKRF